MNVETDVVVVVPTIREASIKEFLSAWQWPCQVIVVEDNPEPTFDLGNGGAFSWESIRLDLGGDEWIIPRRSDCIRSYGFWKAWQTGKPYIITLDDDCLPGKRTAERFVEAHLTNLQPRPVERWWSTLDNDYPRGYPYEQHMATVPIAISHGHWTHNLDYDSISLLHYSRVMAPVAMPVQGIVPFGHYFPMCGMNLAWRREYTPLMYFGLMGQDHEGHAYPYDRFGDIWCGIITKKILDHLGVAVWSGAPFVEHRRASNVWANFHKEHAGIEVNETLWRRIDAVRLQGDTPIACYLEVARALAPARFEFDPYWGEVSTAMRRWSDLYA